MGPGSFPREDEDVLDLTIESHRELMRRAISKLSETEAYTELAALARSAHRARDARSVPGHNYR